MVYKNASVIFDLDGTLVDSAPDLLNTVNYIMDRLDRPEVRMETLRPHVGKGAKVMMQIGLEQDGGSSEHVDLDALLPQFLSYYSDNIAVDSRPYEGCVEELQRLLDRGALLAVCTNKREKLANKALEELELISYFKCVISPDTLGVKKPDPQHLLQTIERIGGHASHSVMIGDGAPDIHAAQAADVPVVGVSFGYTDIPLEDLGPDAIIGHYRELPQVLEKLLTV